MGCSAAYHLAKFGQRDVIVLERHKPTSGTTWHSAAQVRTLRASASLTQLIGYGVELYKSLEQETGQATGWLNTGSLTVAGSADRMIALRRMAALARGFGIAAQVLSTAEAAGFWPAMRTDDLHGAVLLPGDGRVNPTDLCAALIKGAQAQGVRFFEETAVTGLRLHNGRIAGVETPAGTIETATVVNCAGLWGRSVADLAGVAAPLHACEHFYVMTQDMGLPKGLPTLGDPDGMLYMREERGGMLVGCFEPRGKALPLEALPPGFAFGLLPDDWDHFEPMMMNAIHRVPRLEDAPIRTFLNGPESFTFDDRFLLGEAPGLRGLFFLCGMNSVGIASAGGGGRAIAEWIIEGRPSLDLAPLDIRRFPPFLDNLKVLRDRVPETLGLHYAIPYPNREPQTARGLRRSPVHQELEAAGAQFGQRSGWERPLWFEAGAAMPALTFGAPAWLLSAAAEHRAARQGAVLLDQTPLAKLMVCGRDAEAFLQRVCSRDVGFAPGRLGYTLMLNDRGGIQSDLVAMRLERDRYLLVTGAAQVTRDLAWLEDSRRPEEAVSIVDVGSGWATLGLMGPASRAVMAALTPVPLDPAAFPFGSVRRIEVGRAPAWAARVSYVGELGWELHVPSEWARTLYEDIMEAGVPLGLIQAGLHAMASLRLEKGFRAWGADVGPYDDPVQAGLMVAVTAKKTGFVGREAVMTARAAGASRRLLNVTVDPEHGWVLGEEPLLRDGRPVGALTSIAFGHTVGKLVGLAWVERSDGVVDESWLAHGNFTVDLAGVPVTAALSAAPPYDPSGVRMRS
jgi:4-methylaminobutanoate oxidase (formaldehyde-forming)